MKSFLGIMLMVFSFFGWVEYAPSYVTVPMFIIGLGLFLLTDKQEGDLVSFTPGPIRKEETWWVFDVHYKGQTFTHPDAYPDKSMAKLMQYLFCRSPQTLDALV